MKILFSIVLVGWMSVSKGMSISTNDDVLTATPNIATRQDQTLQRALNELLASSNQNNRENVFTGSTSHNKTLTKSNRDTTLDQNEENKFINEIRLQSKSLRIKTSRPKQRALHIFVRSTDKIHEPKDITRDSDLDGEGNKRDYIWYKNYQAFPPQSLFSNENVALKDNAVSNTIRKYENISEVKSIVEKGKNTKIVMKEEDDSGEVTLPSVTIKQIKVNRIKNRLKTHTNEEMSKGTKIGSIKYTKIISSAKGKLEGKVNPISPEKINSIEKIKTVSSANSILIEKNKIPLAKSDPIKEIKSISLENRNFEVKVKAIPSAKSNTEAKINNISPIKNSRVVSNLLSENEVQLKPPQNEWRTLEIHMLEGPDGDTRHHVLEYIESPANPSRSVEKSVDINQRNINIIRDYIHSSTRNVKNIIGRSEKIKPATEYGLPAPEYGLPPPSFGSPANSDLFRSESDLVLPLPPPPHSSEDVPTTTSSSDVNNSETTQQTSSNKTNLNSTDTTTEQGSAKPNDSFKSNLIPETLFRTLEIHEAQCRDQSSCN